MRGRLLILSLIMVMVVLVVLGCSGGVVLEEMEEVAVDGNFNIDRRLTLNIVIVVALFLFLNKGSSKNTISVLSIIIWHNPFLLLLRFLLFDYSSDLLLVYEIGTF